MHIDMMLADYAMVHGHKLFISGAGINVMYATPIEGHRYIIYFGVGLIVTVPQRAINQDHRLLLSMTDTGNRDVVLTKPYGMGEPPPDEAGKFVIRFNVRPPAPMSRGEEVIIPLAFQCPGLEVPRPGTYILRADVDGKVLALKRFNVKSMEQPEAMLALAAP